VRGAAVDRFIADDGEDGGGNAGQGWWQPQLDLLALLGRHGRTPMDDVPATYKPGRTFETVELGQPHTGPEG
jgi:hypothetical protein